MSIRDEKLVYLLRTSRPLPLNSLTAVMEAHSGHPDVALKRLRWLGMLNVRPRRGTISKRNR